jgi:murein DD-endopeptidase MepM/ murein hydrolase activator NlpD
MKLFTKEFILSFVVVFSPIIYPATVQAGFFSAVSQVFNSSASAKTKEDTVIRTNLQNMPLLQAPVNLDPKPYLTDASPVVVSDNALVAEISPRATIVDVNDVSNTLISTYVVRSGDSLAKIASIFNVSVNTIVWSNSLGSTPTLKEGQTLIILPISGVQHAVRKGETISGIVASYKADLNEVLEYNNLTLKDTLAVGDLLIIPDGEIRADVSAPATKTTSSKYVFKTNPVHGANGPYYPDYYMRPITGGYESQGLHGYNAVDLAAPKGTPIYASAAGVVIASMTGGWNGGYGNYIIISHSNGTQTLYAHNNENLVVPGQTVEKGQLIGKIGATGKATGPHIHFEIRGAKNPF